MERQYNTQNYDYDVDRLMGSADAEGLSELLHATAILSLTRRPFIAIISCRSKGGMNTFDTCALRSFIQTVVLLSCAVEQGHQTANTRHHYILTREIRIGVATWVAVAVIVLLNI